MKPLLVLVPFLLTALPAMAQWSEEAKLVPGDLGPGDAAGRSISISGDTVLVGAPLHDGVATDAGAAYVYVRAGDGWVQQAKLRALDGGAGDEFGYTVAIDGNTAIIGAPYHSNPPGAAYVFVRSGGTWTQQAKLQASFNDWIYFGRHVVLDGDTAVISENDPSGTCGLVYVFVRTGSTWTLQKQYGGNSGPDYDGFGCDFDLDGDWLVIGEAGYDGWYFDEQGAAWLYHRTGSSWAFAAEITTPYLEDGFCFGWSVAIDDGKLLIAAGPHRKSVYAYQIVGSGVSYVGKLTAPTTGNRFGEDISLDGNHALIDGNGSPTSGYAAYLTRWTGAQWTLPEPLYGWGTQGTSDLDHGTVVMGDPGDDDAGVDAGAAHVLTSEPGTGFCFGDPGSGTPCPCANDNDGSVPGSGCDNGVFASGAKLSARGIASVSHDSVVLFTERAEPSNSGLYFQADNRVNGGAGIVFGDGLRCAGGQLVRLQVRFADASGYSATTVGLAAKGGVGPGSTERYQCWYRNQSTPACGLGVNEFNLSNGYEIFWGP